jgi:drug/metabolite transporter (DMT)-like permease
MGAPERLVEALGRPEDVRLMTGVCLAIGGNLLISVALNLTKHAHNKNQMAEHRKPYMHLWLWWLGFLATLVGEMGNFSAYGFAPASLIAPLGAVSVISNAFIASFFLGEGFRLRDLVGCALCIGGGVVIVLAGTSHPAAPDFKGFLYLVQDPVFLAYMACLSLVTALMLGFQDKYGDAHVSYYVLLCSMIGSVTVLACKGVSTMLNMWACCGGAVPFGQPVLYGLLFVLGATAVLQVRVCRGHGAVGRQCQALREG